GPEGGSGGGRVVAEGTPEEVAMVPASHTGRFLAELLDDRLELPPSMRNGARKASAATPAPTRNGSARNGSARTAAAKSAAPKAATAKATTAKATASKATGSKATGSRSTGSKAAGSKAAG